MITNGFTYIATLLFMAASLVTLDHKSTGKMKKFFRVIPAVVLCYLVAMLLCTFGLWDLAKTKPAYSALKNSLTYTMILSCYFVVTFEKSSNLAP